MHPFLDPQKLTDDQINEKLSKCMQYLTMQRSLGHMTAVESIEAVIQTLDSERQRRFQLSIQTEMEKQNPTRLNSIDIGDTEEIQEKFNENK